MLTGAGSAGAAGPDPIAGTTFAAVHSGKCLNVKGGGEANGTPVQQYRCVGAANERWRAVPQDDGTYQLVGEQSWKCLNVPGLNTADSVPVEQYACVAGAAFEKWTPTLVPGTRNQYTLVAKHSGKCLNVKGASLADSAVVQQYRCVGATNERWFSTPDNPPLPVDPAPRSSLLQSAPGAPLQLAHVDGYGKAYYGTANPRSAAATWSALPGPESFTGPPALLPAGTGGQVLALGLSNNVWGRSGPQPTSAGWLGTGGPVQSPPVTASAPNGRRYASPPTWPARCGGSRTTGCTCRTSPGGGRVRPRCAVPSWPP